MAVRPEFQPTLVQLLAGRPRGWRYGLIGFYVVVLAIVLYALLLRPDPDSRTLVSRGEAPFAFRYDDAFRRVSPRAPEIVRLEASRGRRVAVAPLRLPAYQGRPDSFLPAYTERLVDRMEREYSGFQRRNDGRPAINRIPGYEIVFQYRNGDRVGYGRRILLLNSYADGAREGVDLTLLEDRSNVVPAAEDIGTNGSLRTLLRSFSFGTSPA